MATAQSIIVEKSAFFIFLLYKSVIIFSHHPHRLVWTDFEVGANSLPAGVRETAFLHHAAGGGIAGKIGAP